MYTRMKLIVNIVTRLISTTRTSVHRRFYTWG